MATDQNFVDFVLDQLAGVEKITCKKMFGEYGIWANGKIFALVCDNKLFIKPTDAGRAFIGNPTEVPPYPGAKNSFLIEDKLDDREWLVELVNLSLPELPMPKPRKKKKKK